MYKEVSNTPLTLCLFLSYVQLAAVKARRAAAAAKAAEENEGTNAVEEARRKAAMQANEDSESDSDDDKKKKKKGKSSIAKLDKIAIKKMKPAQLKEALKERGLDIQGNAKQLIERLLAHEKDR